MRLLRQRVRAEATDGDGVDMQRFLGAGRRAKHPRQHNSGSGREQAAEGGGKLTGLRCGRSRTGSAEFASWKRVERPGAGAVEGVRGTRFECTAIHLGAWKDEPR